MGNFEPPRIASPSHVWGIRPAYQVDFGSSTVYQCFPIRNRLYAVITQKFTAILERSVIRQTSDILLSCAVYVPKHDVIIGVSTTSNRFSVLRVSDITKSLTDAISLHQIGVFHMIYAEKSDCLFTIGSDIRIWKLNVEIPESRVLSSRPKIEIVQIAHFARGYDASIINQPCFDRKYERLFVAGAKGLVPYGVHGDYYSNVTKLPVTPRTAVDYLEAYDMIITADAVEGVLEWNPSGTINRRISIGQTSILAVRYINREFILLIDGKNNVSIMDILCSRTFQCFTLPGPPVKINLVNNTLIASIGFTLYFYEINLPWELWVPSMSMPRSIRRCNKAYHAARIAVHGSNGHLTLISPKTGFKLTSATSNYLRSFLYDRKDSDQLFLCHDSGDLSLFSTGQIPCKEISKFNINAFSMYHFGSSYLVVSRDGEVVIYDSDTFQPIKRNLIRRDKIESVGFDERYKTVLLFYNNEVIRIDPTKGSVINRIKNHMGPCIGCFNGYMLVSSPGGKMKIHELTPDLILDKDIELFSGEVTGISFAPNYFISVSTDCTVKIWTYDGNNITTMNFPLPLYGVEILNGKRDIVVGTDSELMIISGDLLFEGERDPEDRSIDNYDQLDDDLFDEVRTENTEVESEDQSILVSQPPLPPPAPLAPERRAPRLVSFKEPDRKLDKKRALEEMLDMVDDEVASMQKIKERMEQEEIRKRQEEEERAEEERRLKEEEEKKQKEEEQRLKEEAEKKEREEREKEQQREERRRKRKEAAEQKKRAREEYLREISEKSMKLREQKSREDVILREMSENESVEKQEGRKNSLINGLINSDFEQEGTQNLNDRGYKLRQLAGNKLNGDIKNSSSKFRSRKASNLSEISQKSNSSTKLRDAQKKSYSKTDKDKQNLIRVRKSSNLNENDDLPSDFSAINQDSKDLNRRGKKFNSKGKSLNGRSINLRDRDTNLRDQKISLRDQDINLNQKGNKGNRLKGSRDEDSQKVDRGKYGRSPKVERRAGLHSSKFQITPQKPEEPKARVRPPRSPVWAVSEPSVSMRKKLAAEKESAKAQTNKRREFRAERINKIDSPLALSPRSRTPRPPRLPLSSPELYSSPRKRCGTPPVLRRPPPFFLPTPNIVIDTEEVIKSYIRGEKRLLPLITRLHKNDQFLVQDLFLKELKTPDLPAERTIRTAPTRTRPSLQLSTPDRHSVKTNRASEVHPLLIVRPINTARTGRRAALAVLPTPNSYRENQFGEDLGEYLRVHPLRS